MKPTNSISVFTSNAVLLTGIKNPTPATIEIDKSTGKILAIHEGRANRSEEKYKDIADESWVDLGDKWILPGIFE